MSGLPPRVAGIRWQKVVRRVHLYAGLVLFPWILFFGFSGFLFNHPNIGETVTGQGVPPPEWRELARVTPWEPVKVAHAVIGAINRSQPGRAYALDESFASRFTGPVIFKAPAPNGQHMLFLVLERGGGFLATRAARPTAEAAPFNGQTLELPAYAMDPVRDGAEALLEARKVAVKGPVRAEAKLVPDLEFRMLDRDGVRWNVQYDFATSSVTGRRSDAWPNLGMSQLFGMLHTTHHFTKDVGARWFWALFEDLLGLTMVVWALTGLVMWWQVKPTRVIGAASIGIAFAVAGIVFYGTARERLFGDVKQELGPGEKVD